MKTRNILWGILSQKPEALEYMLSKKPVLMSTLIVFISALFSSILVLLTERNLSFIFLSLNVFLRIIVLYWLMFSIVVNLGFKIIYRTKTSLSQILSFIGMLSPLFSISLTLWELIIRVTSPNIIYLLISVIPTIYFMILLLDGLATIYQQPRRYLVSLVILAMIVWVPIIGILRYVGGLV